MYHDLKDFKEDQQYPNIIILISKDNILLKKIRQIIKKFPKNIKLKHLPEVVPIDFKKMILEENISAVILDSQKMLNMNFKTLSKYSFHNLAVLVETDDLNKTYSTFDRLKVDIILKDPEDNYLLSLEYKLEKYINYFIMEKKYSTYKKYLNEMVLSPDSDLRIEMAERALALEALHESENRFQDILKNSRDIAYRLNLYTGKYDYISASFEKITGYPVLEVLDNGFLNIVKLFHPEDKKKFKNYYSRIDKRIFKENDLQEIEYRLLCKNGEYKWLSDSRMVIANDDGTSAIIGNIRDITERKKVSEELIESERIAEALLNNPLDSVLIVNLGGQILNLNKSMSKLLGKSKKQIIGKNVYDLIPEGLVDAVNLKAEKVIKNKRIIRFEDEYQNSWFDHSLYPVLVDNEIIKMVLFSRDITGRKLAEIEKSEANRILDQIFHSSPSGMCIINNDLKIVRVNKSFLNLFKIKEETVVNHSITSIIGKDPGNKHLKEMKKILSGSKFTEYETKINFNDNEMDFHISVVPFYSENGEIIGSINNFLDVTKERYLQKIIIQIIQDERQRIGQELHDGLGQNLTAIAFLVEILNQKMKASECLELEDVTKIENLMKNAIRQTRSISRMLYPVEMEKNGLNAAIENLIENIEKVYDINFELYQDRNFLIGDHNVANHLFYMVREAINSSIKHGNAENITIKLKSSNHIYSLIVEDDCENFDTIMFKNREMSLRIMEYRSNMIGAEFLLEKKEEKGYQIRVNFQL